MKTLSVPLMIMTVIITFQNSIKMQMQSKLMMLESRGFVSTFFILFTLWVWSWLLPLSF